MTTQWSSSEEKTRAMDAQRDEIDSCDQRGTERAPAEIVQKEVFGPVLSITPFDDNGQALDWANASEYGLGSSVWSQKTETAMEIANGLEYGVTWINTHGVMATEMPHGGMKNSGYGSDLSMQSLIDYTQIRHLMLG